MASFVVLRTYVKTYHQTVVVQASSAEEAERVAAGDEADKVCIVDDELVEEEIVDDFTVQTPKQACAECRQLHADAVTPKERVRYFNLENKIKRVVASNAINEQCK